MVPITGTLLSHTCILVLTAITAHNMYNYVLILLQYEDLPLDEDVLEGCRDITNLTFTYVSVCVCVCVCVLKLHVLHYMPITEGTRVVILIS